MNETKMNIEDIISKLKKVKLSLNQKFVVLIIGLFVAHAIYHAIGSVDNKDNNKRKLLKKEQLSNYTSFDKITDNSNFIIENIESKKAEIFRGDKSILLLSGIQNNIDSTEENVDVEIIFSSIPIKNKDDLSDQLETIFNVKPEVTFDSTTNSASYYFPSRDSIPSAFALMLNLNNQRSKMASQISIYVNSTQTKDLAIVDSPFSSKHSSLPIKVLSGNNKIFRNTEHDSLMVFDDLNLYLVLENNANGIDLSGGEIVIDFPFFIDSSDYAETLSQLNKSQIGNGIKTKLLVSDWAEFNEITKDSYGALKYVHVKGYLKDKMITDTDIIKISSGGLVVSAEEGMQTIVVTLKNIAGYADRSYEVSLLKTNMFEKEGNVGIGTMNPSAKLEVNGDIVSKGNINARGNIKTREINARGNINAKGNIRTRDINAKGDIMAGGNIKANGLVYDRNGIVLPRGGIIMWSGKIKDIPKGWALCNGRNGTPDLRNRFIVGAGQYYAYKQTGGKDQVQLLIGEIPSHNHKYSGNVNSNGAHSHNNNYYNVTGKFWKSKTSWSLINIRSEKESSWSKQTENAGKHSHSYSGRTKNTGNAKPHENRPPFYALAYIMKL